MALLSLPPETLTSIVIVYNDSLDYTISSIRKIYYLKATCKTLHDVIDHLTARRKLSQLWSVVTSPQSYASLGFRYSIYVSKLIDLSKITYERKSYGSSQQLSGVTRISQITIGALFSNYLAKHDVVVMMPKHPISVIAMNQCCYCRKRSIILSPIIRVQIIGKTIHVQGRVTCCDSCFADHMIYDPTRHSPVVTDFVILRNYINRTYIKRAYYSVRTKKYDVVFS